MSRGRTNATLALSLALCVCAALASAGQAKVERPVFLVSYCREVTDPFESLEFAVWRDGRVIWRDPRSGIGPDFASHDSDWIMGKYYEGRIPPQRVQAALRQFRRMRLLDKFDLLTCMWPTSSPRRIEITDGAKYSCLALTKGEGVAVSLKAQKVWGRVKSSLMPKSGRLVSSPDTSQWW